MILLIYANLYRREKRREREREREGDYSSKDKVKKINKVRGLRASLMLKLGLGNPCFDPLLRAFYGSLRGTARA